MHPRLTELLAYAEAQRDALLTAALAVPAERWTERPSPDRWSLAELCQHLHLAERGSARLIAKRAAEARAANHPPETGTGSMMGALDGRGITDRSRPLDAPDRVKPREAWTRDQALEALASSRAELRAAVAAADGLALGTVTAAHPRLGEIDLYQWILFVGQHEARHVPQAAEIVQQLVPAGR
jgi:hypothetical protein